MRKLTLRPSGEVIEIEENKNILQACREKGIYLKSSCGGHATCSDCVIKVVSGVDNLSPAPFNELKLLGNVFHITKERLACQTCLTGDVTIDISAHDKDSDEVRMKNKATSFQKKKLQTKVRKPEEVQEIKEERFQKREEKNKDQATWQKHWEKPNDGEVPAAAKPKRLDGNRRPKLFSTDGLENMVNSDTKGERKFNKDDRYDKKRNDQKFSDQKPRPVKPKDAGREENREDSGVKYSSEENNTSTKGDFKSFRDKSKK
ncbi:MAG: 2Fe-2S iron-sulfur cluster binding domain-containing protein [Bacteriovoracaceae bacterium]|nr:2Fe-2S iron-sulfur cluster binding domain-containing protein [Bacteriovoracaceae bacterium]